MDTELHHQKSPAILNLGVLLRQKEILRCHIAAQTRRQGKELSNLGLEEFVNKKLVLVPKAAE